LITLPADHDWLDDATKNIPIIVITALVQSKSLFDKFSQVKAFVTKPFSADELLTVIKTIQ